jgi:hypothetical protein
MALVDPQQQLAAPATLGQALVVQARIAMALVEMLEEPVAPVEMPVEMLEMLVELVELVRLQAALEGLSQQQAETLLLAAIKFQAACRRELGLMAMAMAMAMAMVMAMVMVMAVVMAVVMAMAMVMAMVMAVVMVLEMGLAWDLAC